MTETVWRTRIAAALLLGHRRIAADRLGRAAILATGAFASASLSVLWAFAVLGTQFLDREIFAHTLGIGAASARYRDGSSFSVEDIRALRTDPRALVACQRTFRVPLPTGIVLPIRRIVTTPAFLVYRAGRLRSGRPLVWTDTLRHTSLAVFGAGLARLAAGQITLDGDRVTSVGVLEPRAGDSDDFVIVELLRADMLDKDCGNGADRSLAIIAPPPELPTVAARVMGTLDRRRGTAPGVVGLDAELAPRSVSLWIRSQMATRGILFGTTALIGLMASFTLAILLEVRNHGRRFELGVARAVGATSADIAAELLAEASMLTLGAVLLGLVPAAIGVYAMTAVIALDVPWMSTLLGPSLLLMLMMGVAVIRPIREAAKQAPAVALGVDQW